MIGEATSRLTSDLLRYGLALTVAGLLPVKRPFAYRAVWWGLGLLWASAVLSWNPMTGVSSWWSVLAGLEALAFFGLGLWQLDLPIRKDSRIAILKPLALPARNGAWAVTGTAILLYCLVLFPLLGRGLQLDDFSRSALDFPFPLVLFTCAVLFFTVDREADLALAPLLFGWALPGGPSFPRTGRAELPGLEVALLAGVLFLQLPIKLRAGGERGEAYRVAVQRRAVFGYGLWALALATTLLIFLLKPGAFDKIEFHLSLLCALGAALWLLFPAWQSLWFRYAAWHGARAAGRAWMKVRENWKWALLLLLVILLIMESVKPDSQKQSTAAARNHNATVAPTPSWPKWLTAALRPSRELRRIASERWWELLFTAALLWLASEIYGARKRLVIGKFTNHTGDPGKETWVQGLGLGLQSELARIADLYRVIDDAQPSLARAMQRDILGVTAGVEDVGEILKDATVSFGALHLSTKFLSGMLSRIFSSTQLTGALSQLDNHYILTAQRGSGRWVKSWRVDSGPRLPSDSDAPAAASLLQQMVEELAYRVATDLVPIGSPRWQAVRCYTEGLRFYRETQNRLKNRHLYLREAERCLIQALNEDQTFTQCYYNLGVVYEDLGQTASAEAAFRRALAEDPARYDACYALATIFTHEEKFLEAAWFSRAAIAIDASQAHAWDLLAFARRQQDIDRPDTSPGLNDDKSKKEIREEREIAVALAWRALCRAALRGGEAAERERDPAILYTRNLAVVLVWEPKWREESLRLLQQAAWIDPQSPALRFHRGRAFLWSGDKGGAAAALDGTLADGLDVRSQGFLWYVLAMTRPGEGESRREAVRLVHRRFLDIAASASTQELDQLIRSSLRSWKPGPSSPAPSPQDNFAELRKHGFPWGEEEEGYREHLLSLCQFLAKLEGEADGASGGDWGRITSSLQKTRQLKQARIEMLENLATSLGSLLDTGRQTSADILSTQNLAAWRLAKKAGEDDEAFHGRCSALEPLLDVLAVPSKGGCDGPLIAMSRLARTLKPEDSEGQQRLRECLEECLEDWEWAYLQVRVRLACACLEEADADAEGSRWLELAESSLREAIPKLEQKNFRQLRRQGLYGLLARTQIRRARVAQAGREERQALPEVTEILAHARQSVSLDPITSRERLVLVEALATLGDYEAMRVEAEIARELDPGTETLRTIGANYWRRVATLSHKEERNRFLEEAARFFKEALRYLDCAPLASEALPELRETFGWAHFWLGRFQCERALYAESSAHLSIAAGMGFKPLEARVELAWTYLLARDLRQAEAVFKEAIGEAKQHGGGAGDFKVAPGPGEEREIDDLYFDACLGWALLAAERDPALALERIGDAQRLVGVSSIRRNEQEIALSEARGRAYLCAGEIAKSIKELKEAVKKGGGGGAYCYLGIAELARAREVGEDERPAVLRNAIEAYRRAKAADVRDRFAREIRELGDEIQKLETPTSA